MANISSSGVLVHEATRLPTLGGGLKIRLVALEVVLRLAGPSSLSLDSEVVRVTDTGFAVCFTGDRGELVRLLDRARGRRT